MAFFQFRFPGKSSAAADPLAAAPGESLEVVRRRARHRLLGAVVLVFVAVVAFPLMFDSQPRPVAIDTPIVVPDRKHTPPLAGPVPVPEAQAPATPLLAASSPVPVASSLELGKEEVVLPTAAPAASGAKHGEAAPALPDTPVASASPSPSKGDAKPADAKSKEAKPDQDGKAKSADDGHKAQALLEGKVADKESGKHIVQVGAFADADKVREVRRKLEQAGLKTYTQVIEGKDGKRSTRVRLGPFESRAEAEKAAARVRKLDLPAHLVAL
ncbi:MAG: SPOR domain-containing protein [Betaproteobacteria bacterium]|nr:SPOR domain-containing protein [Betaproteobacteria bacterium]